MPDHWPGEPTATPGVLPDGRAAILLGPPGRFDSAWAGDPEGSACLGLLAADAAARRLPAPRLAEALRDLGLNARVERGHSVEDLAQIFEMGHPAIVLVDAGEVHGDAALAGLGGPNLAALVCCIARDPGSGDCLGAYLLDPRHPPARFVEDRGLVRGWLDAGGLILSVDPN